MSDVEVESTLKSPRNDTAAASSAGAFFSHSQHFVVAGGIFTSVANNHTIVHTHTPSDFRMIPLGDIDLQCEIRTNNTSGVVDCCHRGVCARRIYSANIEGRKSAMTVAVYQGNHAEDNWRQDILQYTLLRHPNFVQLYGAASSNGIHASIFYDELIPLEIFLDLYGHSHFLTVYIYAYFDMEFGAAQAYFCSVFQEMIYDCTLWIRRTSGRLCVDLAYNENRSRFFAASGAQIPAPENILHLNEANQKAIVLSSLKLGEYHRLCSQNLSKHHTIFASTSTTVHLGAVYSRSSRLSFQLEDWAEIAYLRDSIFSFSDWGGRTTEKGWTCFTAGDVVSRTFCVSTHGFSSGNWLSQANHIFTCLKISFDYENYVLVNDADFYVVISTSTEAPPPGYLFLCPTSHFYAGPSLFRWPNCPAYWSLDPSGITRLDVDEAIRLGFPSIKLTTIIWGRSWDASTYSGLRQFHRAKDFDPESQDVARRLDYDFFQLSGAMEVSTAHAEPMDESL